MNLWTADNVAWMVGKMVLPHCEDEVAVLAETHGIADFQIAVRPLVREIGNDYWRFASERGLTVVGVLGV